MKVKLSNLDGSAGKGDIELNDAVFGLEPRADILHRLDAARAEVQAAGAMGQRLVLLDEVGT